MTGDFAAAEPPQWSRAMLRIVLPCDPMRDAIFGDLREDFVHETAELGIRRARARYHRRAAGIAAYALFDALRWREWAADEESRASEDAEAEVVPLRVSPTRIAPATAGRLWLVWSHAALLLLSIAVLLAGIAADMTMFKAMQRVPHPGSFMASAVGIAAAALLLGSAMAAAVIMCAGPRWIRGRARAI